MEGSQDLGDVRPSAETSKKLVEFSETVTFLLMLIKGGS